MGVSRPGKPLPSKSGLFRHSFISSIIMFKSRACMEGVNATTGVLQPGTIHYPAAQQTPLLSDKLLARMDKRDRAKMREKGRGRGTGEELIGSLSGILGASWRKVGLMEEEEEEEEEG